MNLLQELIDLRKQITASQAREKILQDALQNLVNTKGRYHTEQAYNKCLTALAKIKKWKEQT